MQSLRIYQSISRRVSDLSVTISAVVGLLVACRRKGLSTELWFGDSHAVLLNRDYTAAQLSRGTDGQIIWHLGPRLLWTISQQGFPLHVRAVARVIRTIARPGALQLAFTFGEIDVRCHLVDRLKDPNFRADFCVDYVKACTDLSQRMGSGPSVIVLPVPPCDQIRPNPDYPMRGTVVERVAAYRYLTNTLIAQAEGLRVRVIQPALVLTGEDGALRPDLTDDGCHVNRKGRDFVRHLMLDA